MKPHWLTPVTRLRQAAPQRDRYGDIIQGGTDTRTPLPPALFAPTRTIENNGPGQRSVTEQPAVYWRSNPDIKPSDRLEIAGDTYEVDGQPEIWPKGTVANLKLVKRSDS